MQTGGVRITGPMTKEDKVRWDMLRARKTESDHEIAVLEKLLRDDPDYPYREQVLQDIEHEKKIRSLIARHLPD